MEKHAPPKKRKITLGATELVDFPELGYTAVQARVDTGAAISSIHCTKVYVTDTAGGRTLVFYTDLGSGKKPARFSSVRFAEKLIKNSSGQVEKRYVIQTQILLFGEKFTTEFSLANRSEMNYPVLLGRKFLRRRFVVDISLRRKKEKSNA